MKNLLPCVEWADKLALNPNDLASDERASLHAHLATCSGCAATHADYQSLMTRLRALPRPALPPLETLAPEMIFAPDAEEQASGASDSVSSQGLAQPGSASTPLVLLPPPRRISWLQRLSALAAVLLLAVLVGSLVLLLHRAQGTTSAAQPNFQMRPGWTKLAEYSGTGSKIITGQEITFPRLYGLAYGCDGSGEVTMVIAGKSSTVSSTFNEVIPCQAHLHLPLVSPHALAFSNIPDGTLQVTITVSAGEKTHWFFQFSQAVSQSTLTLGLEWKHLGGVAGSSNGSSEFRGSKAYKTLGIMVICVGTGEGSIQLTPDLGNIDMPPCTGQPSFVTVHYPSATAVQAVNVSATGDMAFVAEIYGCADEQKCGG